MSTWNRLDLQTLGSQLIMMPKNLPITALNDKNSALGFVKIWFTYTVAP
jgi:hypothetical protein